MTMRLLKLALPFALLMLGAPALAQVAPPSQPAPPAVQPDAAAAADPAMSTLVEGLEVVARPPGPALWRVSRNGAEVVILGTVTPLRHLQTWDQGRLTKEMAGARQVLTPGKATANPLVMIRLAMGGALKTSVPLKDRLPTDLMNHFAADAAAAHKSVAKYDKWKATMAGVLLLGDFDEAAGLSRAKPASTVARLARRMKVPVRPMTRINLERFIHDADKLDDDGHIACLRVALGDLERNAPDPGRLGAAWAAADLRAVNRLYPAPQGCPLLNPVISQQVGETVGALDGALKGGGKTVALVDMTLLLRPDGVLDRLAAAGGEVTTP